MRHHREHSTSYHQFATGRICEHCDGYGSAITSSGEAFCPRCLGHGWH